MIKVTQQGNGFTARIGDSFSHGFLDKDTMYITDIEVDEKMRGHGLGTKLVNAIVKKSRAKHLEAVHIIPKAIPFWKALKAKEGESSFNKNKALVKERESYIQNYLRKQY
jgi:predicted GNAT family acetyltransferase